jgi:cobalt-zinc-cadmium efflux system outer membrane protein
MICRLKKYVPVLFLGVLSAAAAAAESTTPGAAPSSSDLQQLTLHQAEIFFAERNRELQIAKRTVEGAEADILSAGAPPNPNLSIGSAHINPHDGIGSGGLRDKRIDTVIGLSQLFERGNKRELRTGAAQFNAAASRSDRAEVERQQKVALYGAYYDLVLAQEKLRISGETAASFEKTTDAAKLRLKAGDIAPTELARISVDGLRAQNDTRAARAERERAQILLAYLIGVERQATSINAADSWPEIRQPQNTLEMEILLDRRADVQAAQARVSAAEKVRELARSLRTRDITAGVQYEHFPGDTFSENSYGLFVSVPLFTNYYYEGEIRRAESDLQAARDNFERARALAISEISKSRSDLQSAAERVQRFREVLLNAAQKAADGAEFAYSRGAIGVMDLLDARRQFYATRLEAAIVTADYAKALASWRAAIAPSAPNENPEAMKR